MKNFLDRFVSIRDEAGGGEGGGAGAAATGGVDVAALQTQLEALKTQQAATARELETTKNTIAEKDQALEYWHKKATAKPDPAAAAEPDNVDLLEVITGKGTKGLSDVLNKAGFVSQKEVQALIAGTVDQITRDGKCMERFPDLKDASSDMYKIFTKQVAALAKEGIKGSAATEIAAEKAYLQLVDEGKMKPLAQRKKEAEAGDEGGEDETEAERIARANAAGGPTGRRTAAGTERKAVQTAEEKALIQSMCDQAGITVKQWNDRAEKGINYSA